jgi:tetratricopeptide (TPR) repeat protein
MKGKSEVGYWMLDKKANRPNPCHDEPRSMLLTLHALIICILLQIHLFGSDDTAESHFHRADQLAQSGKLDAAIGEYRIGLKMAPDSYGAYNNLGTLYFQKEDYPNAVAAYREADRLHP